MGYNYLPLKATSLNAFLPLIDEETRKLLMEKHLLLGAVTSAGKACGIMALDLYPEGFANVIYLYVSEGERKKGCASGMLSYVSPFLLAAGIHTLYFTLAQKKAGEGEPGLMGFLDAHKAEYTSLTNHLVSVPAKSVAKKLHAKSKQCIPLRMVPEHLIKDAVRHAGMLMYGRILYFAGENTEGLGYAFDPASSAIIREGRITGLLLFIPRQDKKGTVLVFMLSETAEDLAEMFSYAARSTEDFYGEDSCITFAPDNGFGKRMGLLFEDQGTWLKLERALVKLDEI